MKLFIGVFLILLPFVAAFILTTRYLGWQTALLGYACGIGVAALIILGAFLVVGG